MRRRNGGKRTWQRAGWKCANSHYVCMDRHWSGRCDGLAQRCVLGRQPKTCMETRAREVLQVSTGVTGGQRKREGCIQGSRGGRGRTGGEFKLHRYRKYQHSRADGGRKSGDGQPGRWRGTTRATECLCRLSSVYKYKPQSGERTRWRRRREGCIQGSRNARGGSTFND